MKRLFASSSVAVVVVFGLFLFMVGLIHQEAPAYTGERIVFPNKVTFNEETFVKDPIPPKEIIKPVVEVQPEMTTPAIVQSKTTIDIIESRMPTDIKLGGGGTKGIPGVITGSEPNGNNEANPIVMIQPPYPPKALQNNLEGWVKLSYDITITGSVDNVRVIKAKPRGIFESSARKALYKWRYKPSRLDGVAVASNGHVVMLEFNLEKD